MADSSQIRHLGLRHFLLGVLIVFCPLRARAQEKVEDEPFLPGLVATYSDAARRTATRIDHQLSFHWSNRTPDPRLGDGEFTAAWRGVIHPDAKGAYRFHLFGSGEIELKLAGAVVIQRQVIAESWCVSLPLELKNEFQPIELTFRRTSKVARVGLFWSAPHFSLEAVPPRFLFHPRESTVSGEFDRGLMLARALRCERCHGDRHGSPAPDLSRLRGNLSREWLVDWLRSNEQAGHALPGEQLSPRRMPALGLAADQAQAIADWLLEPRGSDSTPGPHRPQANNKPAPTKPGRPARSGEQLFLTLGCLACHSWRDLGGSGWFGGGDLTGVGDKRPAGFFSQWLADPAALNRDHRMPVFSLADDERTALAEFLAKQKMATPKAQNEPVAGGTRAMDGWRLAEKLRCGACHRLPEDAAGKLIAGTGRPIVGLAANSNWERSCAGAPDATGQRPGYRLGKRDALALRQYFSERHWHSKEQAARPDGLLLLAENNCLSCHSREGTRESLQLLTPVLADRLIALGKRFPELATQTPALTPPVLNTVGDKLTDEAIAGSLTRKDQHRTYLQVRMPRFPLREVEIASLVEILTNADRVPPGHSQSSGSQSDGHQEDRYLLAGGRLLSSDGFGCLSCHQVGSVIPSEAPLNSLGPDLSQIDRRIRRSWFERWVRNPARIVPRMEMPSVQIPVAGVLDGKLDDQLAAVWQVLSRPGFEPPPAKPVRILRQTGNDPMAEPVLITDIVHVEKSTRLKPFLVGLANRHNALIDLERAAFSHWTIGDVGRQQTKGKTWYWELAGTTVFDTGLSGPDVSLVQGEKELTAALQGQFITEADGWITGSSGVTLHYRLAFHAGTAPRPHMLSIERKLTPITGGFAQELVAGSLPNGTMLRLQLLSARSAPSIRVSADGRTVHVGDRFNSRISLVTPAGSKLAGDGREVLVAPNQAGLVRIELQYLSGIPVDSFPPTAPIAATGKPVPVEIAPGFIGQRLPLPPDIMPTAIAWRPNGKLVFASLKGQVYEATDTDKDGCEDRLTLLAEGLPAPYGIHAGPGYVDVSVKFGLLRIWDADLAGSKRMEVIASGWGYTTDYHDWAIGLPRNVKGEYFLGIPCQQDKRSTIAARYHGNVLKLSPREPTANDPRRYSISPISAGHRFPTGLALFGDDLFVTDNQGNYNPFNELNHVRPGAHFGFVNTLDRGKPTPPQTPPAIDIPHPWTRSVNGICVLSTPREFADLYHNVAFHHFETHLIGCEYDTRRLIRMTLDKIGDTYQGAAYPLSIVPQDPARGMLGPLSCAVSPLGQIYVGSIRDSGWGAGNNVGELVRVGLDFAKLPCGIARVTATNKGFKLEFTRPVDPVASGKLENYAIQSYRRQATPAYGGPDLDRRTETPTSVSVTPAQPTPVFHAPIFVTLHFDSLRPGFVYEFKLKNLAPGGGEFYPAEAFYTLRVIP